MIDYSGYLGWLLTHGSGSDHANCPYHCEHPQPFMWDGKLCCGKHWHDDGELIEMQACTPEFCEDV